MEKQITHFIKQLTYAKQLHRQGIARDRKDQEAVLKEKDFIIRLLKKKNHTSAELKKARAILRKFKESHERWIKFAQMSSYLAKYGGSVAWQKRWLKVYKEIEKYFQRNSELEPR